MKTKITLLFTILFLGINFGFAQQDEECMTNLSIFSEYVKSKNYDAAYEPWMKVRNKCPRFNDAIYKYGEKILKDKIKKTSGADKTAAINDLMKLWDEYIVNFPNKVKRGDLLSKKGQLMYDNKDILGSSDEQIYNAFDNAYKTDFKTFTNPKALYTYFKEMIALFDSGKKPASELFTKYDEISEKVESEVKNYTQKLNKYVNMEANEEALSRKDKQRKKSYESYLRGYDQISKGMDADLGSRANCSNLIPLYKKNFEDNKNDGLWLQRAMNRLYSKECTDDPLFVKIVQQKNTIEPNASTAYYLGILKAKEGNNSEALKFYNQAVDLETDSYEKAKILYRIATSLKKRGSYSQARSYYRKALQENPSMGKCYLAIAQMYAKSANSCGDDNFSKRAIYWLAAEESLKAGRVDANLKSTAGKQAANYRAKAPTKSEIFAKSNAGQKISFKCWVGGSVTVPQI